MFGKCSHLPTALAIGAAVSLNPVKRVQPRNARFVAVVVVVALVAAACGTETASTSAIDPGSGAVIVDEASPGPAQVDGGDVAADPTSSPSSNGAVATSPPQTPSAETNNDVPVGNFPSFVGSTSEGASFEMASLAGEDVILWFWAPW